MFAGLFFKNVVKCKLKAQYFYKQMPKVKEF